MFCVGLVFFGSWGLAARCMALVSCLPQCGFQRCMGLVGHLLLLGPGGFSRSLGSGGLPCGVWHLLAASRNTAFSGAWGLSATSCSWVLGAFLVLWVRGLVARCMALVSCLPQCGFQRCMGLVSHLLLLGPGGFSSSLGSGSLSRGVWCLLAASCNAAFSAWGLSATSCSWFSFGELALCNVFPLTPF